MPPGTDREGNSQGAQVISGNLVGVEIDGSTSTQNLIEGNLIGTDKSGTADRGNSNEGILIEGAVRQHGGRNDVGGAQRDLGQPVGHPARRVDGDGQLDRGKRRRHRLTRHGCRWATRSTASSSATTRRTTRSAARARGQGNTIAFNVAAGVSVQSGTGDSILSNSIFSNGHLGIDLVAPGDPPNGVTPNQPGRAHRPERSAEHPVVTAVVAGTKARPRRP